MKKQAKIYQNFISNMGKLESYKMSLKKYEDRYAKIGYINLMLNILLNLDIEDIDTVIAHLKEMKEDILTSISRRQNVHYC